MTQASSLEVLMLELINRERVKVGAQPLTFDGDLNDAADNHNSWMLSTNKFSHTGINGTSPGDRMKLEGYVFSGSWTWGENIAWASLRNPAGFTDEIELLHKNLMNSTGHRENILNPNFKEIGIGFTTGQFQGFNSGLVTQDFAKTATNSFLTGISYNDLDKDQFYDINEGLAGIIINARNVSTGATFSTKSESSGAYSLELAPGTYQVDFIQNGTIVKSTQGTIGSKNIKMDLILNDSVPIPTPTQNAINGTASSEILRGTTGEDAISGFAGKDKLFGGLGNDTLTGGTGSDGFVFDTSLLNNIDTITDFTSEDYIFLNDSIFTTLETGFLAPENFVRGTRALDSSDRIIYDTQNGNLSYDSDGTGSMQQIQFAKLIGIPNISEADFVVI